MADRPYETRTVTAAIELREESTEPPVLTGYAATFGSEYRVGHFTERLEPDAFKRTLANTPDVRLLVDHEGQPLARTKSGTLELSTDARGLSVRATLDPTDPDVQRLLPKMRRGDLDQMSFAFRVPTGGDVWDYSGDLPKRSIREAVLHGGDVSVVTYPANEDTAASVRDREGRDANATLLHALTEELRAGRPVDQPLMRRVLADIQARTVGDSFNDTQSALRDALQVKFGDEDGDEPFDLWVQDAGPDWVVWTSYGDAGPGAGTWRAPYTVNNAEVTITGDPVKVTVETTYQPVQQQNSAPAEPETPEEGVSEAFSLAVRQAEVLALRSKRPA